ncbi:hypothetical protein NQ314_019519 [Rhamnusium bicolor]|uniref:Sensory neuron membrane protein 1 n=1 Tax=Rhamnusium bicolor TaxID=1586634 RepID=A0AAV8WNF4_9CUCU|nr:hypothetical protein NQ314_019519 [Rhamnusium bicolor]
MKMKFPVKLGIGSLGVFLFIIVVGFVIFPKMISSKVKGYFLILQMVALIPKNEIRGMFLKVPFGLSFKVYMFNVTNPMEVQSGKKPSLQEVGPFCYEEWKEKVNVADDEEDDTIFYDSKDTFIKKMWPGCLSGEEEVTIPHPMILAVVNTVMRQKPGALSLINKAIKSIFSNPTSIFVTAKANDILFDGVIINCGVKDFAGKAICSQLKEAPTLKRVSEDELAFSLLAPVSVLKPTGELKTIAIWGGSWHMMELKKMDVWPTDECNEIKGTDGTIFPPFLAPEEGLVSFAPDLCRSLAAFFVQKTKYDGIPVREYSANLGDMSTNADEKCYCLTPDTCLKKGLMDLYKCSGAPIYTTGSPVYAKKRLQFSMPLQPNPKVDLFNNFTDTVLPMFWVEEGVALNITFTKQLKDFFKIKKIVKISKWIILLGSLGGIAAAGYLFYTNTGKADITPVHKVQPSEVVKSAISTINGNNLGGQVNHVMSTESEKY